jgi:S1-C subfamily serine protease
MERRRVVLILDNVPWWAYIRLYGADFQRWLPRKPLTKVRITIRRRVLLGTLGACVALSFLLGAWASQVRIERQIAENDARIVELRDQMARSVLQTRRERVGRSLGTDGNASPDVVASDADPKSTLIQEIKSQLQSEMGLLPIRVLRERRKSFVEVDAFDASGKRRYSTAGYLGNGHFITVKHGVMALTKTDPERQITSVKLHYNGKALPATVVDSGTAQDEVDPGDWAIIKVKAEVDLPPLQIDTSYAYNFADPIFRLGNDYSKGIILSTGYIGQRMEDGLVTSLTDGHPGVSGGGVLDQQGNLVGIPIGRMEADYRFSFILPLRDEMFRKVPGLGGE